MNLTFMLTTKSIQLLFSIAAVSILAGSLPRKQQRLVEAWAELHQEELLADWNLLLAGQSIEPIKPLQ